MTCEEWALRHDDDDSLFDDEEDDDAGAFALDADDVHQDLLDADANGDSAAASMGAHTSPSPPSSSTTHRTNDFPWLRDMCGNSRSESKGVHNGHK